MQKHFEAFEQTAANFVPLTPISFLNRAEAVHGDRNAVIYGDLRRTWREMAARVRSIAGGLQDAGIHKGDTVSVLCPNAPAMFELHFALPLSGGVLNAINTRLEAETIAYILDHADSKMVIVNADLVPLLKMAFEKLGRYLPIIIVGEVDAGLIEGLDCSHYEELAASSNKVMGMIDDEWQAIALNYTSGTSGRPKGVVYHHRGAYLIALGTAAAWQMPYYLVYLSVVPMFHCNGWGHPWVMAMLGGTAVFTKTPAANELLAAIKEHKVTHFGGAPVVLQMMTEANEKDHFVFDPPVQVLTAGAPPPPSVLEKTKAMGFNVMQVYGLTETYGHITQCIWQDEWAKLTDAEQAEMQAQQGVAFPMVEEVSVISPDTQTHVPRDGVTQGEIVIRGNVVMKGYYKDPEATAKAFRDGVFWSGDAAVMHPDGNVQIRDRLKDVIISGGENISSVEVEAVLYRHPAVQTAAVVAKPDPKWGETPCAFVELRAGVSASSEDIISFCREHLAGFKTPKTVVFCDIPKTSTGKIQKFQLREIANSMDG